VTSRLGPLHAPELKAAGSDSSFDFISRKVVGRVLIGGYRADQVPRTELLRQLASRDIPGKCSELRFPSDLNMEMRICRLIVPCRRGMGGALDAAARPVPRPIRFFGGAAIKPSRIGCLRASLCLRRADPASSLVGRSDGFS
jgi:hypothetical protein